MSLYRGSGQRVEDPIATADSSLVVHCVGETETWLHVVEVHIEWPACVRVGKLELALQIRIAWDLAGERRRRAEIEPAIAVVTLCSRHVKIVSDPEIERQLAGNFPVILQIPAVIFLC